MPNAECGGNEKYALTPRPKDLTIENGQWTKDISNTKNLQGNIPLSKPKPFNSISL